MPRKRFDRMNCSVAQSLEVLGDWWTLLIVREALSGTSRFSDFERHLGVAKNVLADRLEHLVDHGVLVREEVGERGRRLEYRPTRKGKDLLTVITALREWSDRWVYGEGREPLVVRDRRTGRRVPPLRIRDEQGRPIAGRELVMEPGPGADARTRRRLAGGSLGRLGRVALPCVAAALLSGACQAGRSPSEPPARAPRLFDGLGGVHHPISSANPDAQRYFDQGLALAYGFNHEGAIDAYREAARLDPKCAICWWGIAFAHGPNINAPMGPEAGREAWRAAQEAKRLAEHASPAERWYIEAIALRYAADADATAGAGGAPNRRALDLAFASAMGEIAHRHPEDADAQALYAESLLDLSPWNYWHDDGSPREFTQDAAAAIEAALARNPDHTGALHYKIHLYERFEPEKAEDAADRLATQAPDAGHLVHMPSHIYYRLGRYRDAAEINEAAAAADVAYFSWCRAPAAYAALYYTHNLHFLWASHLIEGRSDAAMTAARRLVAQIPADQLAAFPFLEDFLVLPYYTQARFGRFDEVLGEPRPPAEQRFATAIWHYARGLAHVRAGDLGEAEVEQAALVAIAADPELAAMVYDTSGGTAGQRMDLAKHHLAAEIAAARGDGHSALAELRAGIGIQDAMPYAEPPPFYLPLRQVLGAALLAQGRPDEAEAVYLEDLRQHPRNGWSLFGLSKSYKAQGKSAQAKATLQGYRNAFARADVELEASRL